MIPKIIYTNTDVEHTGGGRDAALLYTAIDGKTELTLPDNVRVYTWAGAQHGPGAFPPSKGVLANLPQSQQLHLGHARHLCGDG